MVSQDKLRPAEGSRHKRKRIGRGLGSGHGRYSTQGCKGQNARSGGGVKPFFEGGQLPLVKRLPYKRGFTNIFKTQFSLVNVNSLNIFEPNTFVSPAELQQKGLIKSLRKPVKILGNGEVKCPLVVKASKFSKVARGKIEEAGGRAEFV